MLGKKNLFFWLFRERNAFRSSCLRSNVQRSLRPSQFDSTSRRDCRQVLFLNKLPILYLVPTDEGVAVFFYELLARPIKKKETPRALFSKFGSER